MNFPLTIRTNKAFNKSISVKSPAFRDAEKSVLGDNVIIVPLIRFDRVSNDFYLKEHRQIYRVMARLLEQGKPMVFVVAESLHVVHELEQVGGEIYLFELVIISNCQYYGLCRYCS